MAMEHQALDGVELTNLVQEPGAATMKLQSSLLDHNLPKNEGQWLGSAIILSIQPRRHLVKVCREVAP